MGRSLTAVRVAMTAAGVLLWICAAAGESPSSGEVKLHNGIVLPSPWPPSVKPTYEPPRPPYLDSPPSVTPIAVGRQLFVDDFLVQKSTLTRTFHKAVYHGGNPVLKPDKPWEMKGQGPTAMPFSDGVWYDPADRLFKMWYMGGWCFSTCYAQSRDGLRWEKPVLDVVKGTNIVQAAGRDSSTVWLDLEETDPARRFKMFRIGSPWAYSIHFSRDGIHWSDAAAVSGRTGDRSTVFRDPFLGAWVFGIRADSPYGRYRRYWRTNDLAGGLNWQRDQAPYWIGADRLDVRRQDHGLANTAPQLYNLDCAAYEGLIVGLFSVWRGQPKDRPKINEICLGFSRDGFHWDRPSREAFLGVSERKGDWNWGNIQSSGGCFLVVGDKLYFYVSGRAGVPNGSESGVCSTGLATLRRDGFASMDAGAAGGELTTRPVVFAGKCLFVNVDAAGADSELRVEVLDQAGGVIQPFTLAACAPVRADSTRQTITWRGAPDLSALSGKAVRFRFHLKAGKLYSFWVSRDATGASGGYVAAGGPGFIAPTDTVGAARAKP